MNIGKARVIILILLVHVSLLFPHVSYSQGRSVYDRGVTLLGDWHYNHDHASIYLESPYVYIANNHCLFLLWLARQNGLRYPVPVDTLGEAAHTSMVVKDGVLVFGVNYDLHVAQRNDDSLTILYNDETYAFVPSEITDNNLIITGNQIIDLNDPFHPEVLWTNSAPMRYGAVLVGDRMLTQHYDNGPIYLYDISDLHQPTIIDSIRGYSNNPFNKMRRFPSQVIDNRYVLMSVSDNTYGNCLIFISLDDNRDLQDVYWWSCVHHGGSNSTALKNCDVYQDSLFVVFSGYGRHASLYFFDPDLLPEDPTLMQVELPGNWDNAHRCNVAFDDPLLIVDNDIEGSSFIFNISDPETPLILYEDENLIDHDYYLEYLDLDGQNYLVKPHGRRGVSVDIDGYMILDLFSGGYPDTVCVFDNMGFDSYHARLCDSLLLYMHENDMYLRTFSNGEHELAYVMEETVGENYPVFTFDLTRMEDRYFVAIEDTAHVHIYELLEDNYVLLDTISCNGREFYGMTFTEQGLFLCTRDTLFWYNLNRLNQFEFLDYQPIEEYNPWFGIIVQDGEWLGCTNRLFLLHDNHMGLMHEYESDSEEYYASIRAINGNRINLDIYRNGVNVNTIYEFEEGSYTNFVASTYFQADHYALFEDTLWAMDYDYFSKYLITGYDASPEPDRVSSLPNGWILYPPYPNPFNSTATVRFSVPQPSPVRLTLYNLLGQEVQVISNRTYNAGQHVVHLNGTSLASGIYFVSLDTGVQSRVRRLILLK